MPAIYVAFSNIYAHPLPAGHRFPMIKYELIPEQLKYEGTLNSSHFYEPKEVDEKYILMAHDEDYWKRLKSQTLTYHEIRRIGFPLSEKLVERELIITQGSIDGALYSLDFGCSLNVAGGTHHAGSNWGEGFCLLNDQAIASHYLLSNNHSKKILIIDLDVHQGNGTASIFSNNSQVFTFSMHGKNNYPLHKEQSDLDIELEDHTSDSEFLYQLNQSIDEVMKQFIPDFIFYQCGVDVLAADKLGKLGLSLAGSAERDELVFSFAQALDCPIVCTMGGGYAPEIRTIIEAHTNTFRRAQKYF
jgi:acetoin utilization deacetylase AcuC-like enzyme